jgi:CDP-glycerol glycerophosphotransferase (TagB/SpsB family)
VSLFHGSDALIHDSSSFLIDYVYFDKPEFFLADDLTSYKLESDEVSLKVYNSVYYGLKEQEICHFIEDVVIGGNDTMKETRNAVLRQHLLPPGGKSVAQNVVDDIVQELGIPREQQLGEESKK